MYVQLVVCTICMCACTHLRVSPLLFPIPSSMYSPCKGNWSKWLLTELFITSVAMLESDYESEFVNATWLLEKVMGLLDQPRQTTRRNWLPPPLFKRSSGPNFPGVQAGLLMKVRWCEEGVCGRGGGERHMHCPVAEPCRREREQLVGICLLCGSLVPTLRGHVKHSCCNHFDIQSSHTQTITAVWTVRAQSAISFFLHQSTSNVAS